MKPVLEEKHGSVQHLQPCLSISRLSLLKILASLFVVDWERHILISY